MKNNLKFFAHSNLLILLLIFCCSCSYSRGISTYKQPNLEINQQVAENPIMSDRSFAGIRVAGHDTDLVPEYWDKKYEVQGMLATFEDFESKYHNLLVLKTGAAEAAADSFKRWCKRRRISYDFHSFWGDR